MSRKVFSVALRSVNPSFSSQKLEDAFSSLGDWLRFTNFSWFVASEMGVTQIAVTLRKQLFAEDQIIVVPIDPMAIGGFSQEWIWNWFKKYYPPHALPAPAALPPTTNMPGLLGDSTGISARERYYIVFRGQQWFISYRDQHFGPYSTQRLAIASAVDAAHRAGKLNLTAQVLVQGKDSKWRAEWTYGKDPYPPKG